MRLTNQLVVLGLGILMAALLPLQATAGCGCDHPPPGWSVVTPPFASPGKTITLTIERAGVKKDVDVQLATLPRHVMAQWIGNHVIDHHLAEKKKAEKKEDEAEQKDQSGHE